LDKRERKTACLRNPENGRVTMKRTNTECCRKRGAGIHAKHSERDSFISNLKSLPEKKKTNNQENPDIWTSKKKKEWGEKEGRGD